MAKSLHKTSPAPRVGGKTCAGLIIGAACGDWVAIDWDGKDKGLNQFGEDMIQVRLSYGGLPWQGTPPGTVQCHHDIPANPKNDALCTEILK